MNDTAASPVFKPEPITRVGPAPRWWWSGPRREAWRLRHDCQARERALIELHLFIAEELDPDPAPWPAYYPPESRVSQKLADLLQRRQIVALRATAMAAGRENTDSSPFVPTPPPSGGAASPRVHAQPPKHVEPGDNSDTGGGS